MWLAGSFMASVLLSFPMLEWSSVSLHAPVAAPPPGHGSFSTIGPVLPAASSPRAAHLQPISFLLVSRLHPAFVTPCLCLLFSAFLDIVISFLLLSLYSDSWSSLKIQLPHPHHHLCKASPCSRVHRLPLCLLSLRIEYLSVVWPKHWIVLICLHLSFNCTGSSLGEGIMFYSFFRFLACKAKLGMHPRVLKNGKREKEGSYE